MDEFDRLTVGEVAERTGQPMETILALCREGGIDACCFVNDDNSDYYMIEDAEVQRWLAHGARPRMGYAAAIELLQQGKYVRRAKWPIAALVSYQRHYRSKDSYDEWINIAHFREFRGTDWDGTKYSPSAEDLAAIDWVECQIIP